MSLVYLINDKLKQLPPLHLICEQCLEPFSPVFTNVYQLSPNNIWLCSSECRRTRGNERERSYYMKNIQMRGRRKRPDRRGETRRLRFRLLSLLGNEISCSDCKSTDLLEVHHKRGSDAKEDRLRFSGHKHMYGYYIKHQEEASQKLKILCKACNVGKNRKY